MISTPSKNPTPVSVIQKLNGTTGLPKQEKILPTNRLKLPINFDGVGENSKSHKIESIKSEPSADVKHKVDNKHGVVKSLNNIFNTPSKNPTPVSVIKKLNGTTGLPSHEPIKSELSADVKHETDDVKENVMNGNENEDVKRENVESQGEVVNGVESELGNSVKTESVQVEICIFLSDLLLVLF